MGYILYKAPAMVYHLILTITQKVAAIPPIQRCQCHSSEKLAGILPRQKSIPGLLREDLD